MKANTWKINIEKRQWHPAIRQYCNKYSRMDDISRWMFVTREIGHTSLNV